MVYPLKTIKEALKAVRKVWKCHHCKKHLGLHYGDRLYIPKQEVEAILRPLGGITLICPQCGCLNDLHFPNVERRLGCHATQPTV
jgi:hypothetical protein